MVTADREYLLVTQSRMSNIYSSSFLLSLAKVTSVKKTRQIKIDEIIRKHAIFKSKIMATSAAAARGTFPIEILEKILFYLDGKSLLSMVYKKKRSRL